MLHIIFWIAYCIQDILVQFIYTKSVIGAPYAKQLLWSTEAELVLLPFIFIVTYYALYVFLPAIEKQKDRLIIPLLQWVLVTAACVVGNRLVQYYIIDPGIYHVTQHHAPLFTVIDLFYSLFDIGPAVVLALLIKFVRVNFYNREKERALLKEKLETELKFLRNQINPHFLFNTLDTVRTLSAKKSDDAPEVIMQLSKFLNFMLYESGKAAINIGEEMKIIDDYLELERTWCDERRAIELIREIDNAYEPIAPAVLLSFVEQAFRFAERQRGFGSETLIEIKLQSGFLLFVMEYTADMSGTAVGDDKKSFLPATRQIELLYPNHELKVDNERSFFKTSLFINLRSHAKI